MSAPSRSGRATLSFAAGCGGVSNPDLEPDIRVAIFAHISITLRSVTGIVKDLAELVDKLALAQGCPQVLAMGTMVTFKLSERLAALEASGRAQPD